MKNGRMMNLVHFTLLLFFISRSWIAIGQKTDFPIQDWVERLADKEDQIAHKLLEDTLNSLGSPEKCSIIKRMYDLRPEQNDIYQIRISVAYSQFLYELDTCPAGPQAFDLLYEALQSAYEIEDEWLIADIYQLLASDKIALGDKGSGLMYGLLAKEYREKTGESLFVYLPKTYFDLGFLQYQTRDYEESLENLTKALQHRGSKALHHTDTLDDNFKMFAWNTIGLCYEKLENYDQAFEAFHNALTYAQKDRNTFWVGLIGGNRGDVFFKQGAYDSAQVLLQKDYQTSLAYKQYDNAANSLQWLARISLAKGKSNDALEKGREANQLLSRMPNPDYNANLLYTFALIYKNLGNADSSFHYLEKFRIVHDANEKRVADHRMEIATLRLENQDHVQKILTLNEEKKQITLIRNFIIALILLAAVAGYLYLNKQRLKLYIKQQKALADAENAKAQLKVFTESLGEKTKLVETLQDQLFNKKLNEEQIEHIHELSQHSILTDEDWDQFKSLFNKVFPAFFIDLRQKVPDITLAEQRMAALIKLRVTTRDAASILGISPNSVYKSRQRLRQRLGLDNDEDLEMFLLSEEVPNDLDFRSS